MFDLLWVMGMNICSRFNLSLVMGEIETVRFCRFDVESIRSDGWIFNINFDDLTAILNFLMYIISIYNKIGFLFSIISNEQILESSDNVL